MHRNHQLWLAREYMKYIIKLIYLLEINNDEIKPSTVISQAGCSTVVAA